MTTTPPQPNAQVFALIEGQLRECKVRDIQEQDSTSTLMLAVKEREGGALPTYHVVPFRQILPAEPTRRIVAAVTEHLDENVPCIISDWPVEIPPSSVDMYTYADPQESNYEWVAAAYVVQVSRWRDNNPDADPLSEEETRALHRTHWQQDQQRGTLFTRNGNFEKEHLLVLFPQQEPLVERASRSPGR